VSRPILTELSINAARLQCAVGLRPDTLQQLQILRISYHFRWMIVQPGLVLQLLRLTPNLRSVELTSVMLAVADLEQLIELVEQRACFRHLKRLQTSVNTVAANFTQHSKLLLDSFILSCGVHCQ
jgi:hypothetical protein